jgi:acyl-homoserine lactone acylase PvdQ
MSSWARGIALLNIALLACTVVCIAYLNRFKELSLCPEAQIGSSILSTLAILGHLSITVWFTYAAIKHNTYPSPFDTMSGSKNITNDLSESLITTSNSLNSLNSENDDKHRSTRSRSSCCCSSRKQSLAVTVIIFALLPVFFIYILSAAMAWVRGTTVSDANASLKLSGLLQDSSVSRASQGVVRIDATSEHDLFFTQGAAHAATRLWQMEFQRRLGAGRLAEAVGEGGVEPDKLFRTLGVYAAAERDFENLDSITQNTIQSYCDGVNAYINKAVNSGQQYLPIEFVALGLKPEPWKPADSLVWSKIMSWDLSLNLNDELQRYQWLVSKNITKERINTLKPPYDMSRFPTVLSDIDIESNPSQQTILSSKSFSVSLLTNGMEEAILQLYKEYSSKKEIIQSSQKSATLLSKSKNHQHVFSTPVSFLFSSLRLLGSVVQYLWNLDKTCTTSNSDSIPSTSPKGTLRRNKLIGASNNWVIHGNRTRSNKPLLCNDPHLQLLSPSIWQLTHLSSPQSGFETIGASFIGLPGVVIGRNNFIAWGVTNIGADVQDLYIMSEKNGDTSTYLFNEEYIPYNVSTAMIKVKGGKDIPFTVRSSRFGPIITDNNVFDSFGGPPLSLRWTSIDASIPDTTFSSFRCLNRASNYTTFRSCLSNYVAPSQNFIFADVNGDIGYQMPGWIPQRHPDHSGAYPVPGDSNLYDWLDKVPFDDLPRTLNPPEGFIVSANNRVTPTSYKFNLTMDWDSGSDGYRAKRITQMIKEAPYGSLTASDMQQIQTDYLSLAQRDLAIALYNLSDNLFRVDGGGKVVKNLLFNFDGHLSVGSQVATLWADVLSELGKLANKEVGENWQNMVFLLNALSSDISGTSDPACISSSFSSCAAFAANALDIVADMRGITSGSNLNMIPAWGIDIHKLKIEHAVLSSSPLACVADRIESHGGDGYTINVGSYSDDGYDQTHGPSYRQIIDLAAPDLSLFVHPMGVDGAPFSYDNDDDRISAFNPSGSYDDLLPLWLEGSYVSMSMNGKENSNRLTMRFSPE